VPSDFKLLTKEEIAVINNDPHSSPYMPQQEKGIRPSCALPYELYAEAKLNADKTAVEIQFTADNKVFGNEAAGAPFNVYAPGSYLHQKENEKPTFEPVRTWAYGLTAGDSLTDAWPIKEFEDKNYHLRVYGPNGFFRELIGNPKDPDLEIACGYQPSTTGGKKLSGNIELTVDNMSRKDREIEIIDHAYKTGDQKLVVKGSTKGTALTIDLGKSYGWYDFSVKITGNKNYERRYAGRVETGETSYSDPFMGKVIV
jgi:phospholipase C